MTTEREHGMTLNEWRDVVHALAREKGWYDQPTPRNFGELIALVHSELSEALEEYRAGRYYSAVYANEGSEKPEGIPIELADALIRILDLCGYYQIDVEDAVERKHAYNRSRPRRHGGKVA